MSLPIKGLLIKFLPFWLFLLFYPFGSIWYYTLLSPLGEQVMPLWTVGLLLGFGSFVQLISDVPAGFLVDRFGRLRILRFTMPAFMLSALCLSVGLNIYTYVASLVFMTLGWIFVGPAVSAYALSHAKKNTSGRFLALADVFSAAGVILATTIMPLSLLFLPSHLGGGIFLLFIIALGFLLFSPADRKADLSREVLPAQHFHIRRRFIREVLPIMKKLNPASGMLLILSFSRAIFYNAIWFVVPLIIAMEPERAWLGLGLGIFDTSIVLLGFLIGSLVDRGNKRKLVFFGLLLFAASGMAVGFNFGPLFLLFGFLATTGDETAGLSLWSWLHTLDREHAHDGAVAGVIVLAEDSGAVIAPIFAGFAFTLLGPSWTIVVSAVPIVMTLLYYRFFIENSIRYAAPAIFEIPRKPYHLRRHT